MLATALATSACGGSGGSDGQRQAVALQFARALAGHNERDVLRLAPAVEGYYEGTFKRAAGFDHAGSIVRSCKSSDAAPFAVAGGPCYRICIWGNPRKATSGPNRLAFNLGSLLIIVPSARPTHVKDFAYTGSGEEGPAKKIRIAYKLALPPTADCKPRHRY
jgi:hypothetical protein